MARRPVAARLAFEPLEGRDVPAVILDATVNDDATVYSPTGGLVTLGEVAFDESVQVVFSDGSPLDPSTKFANANDVVTVTQRGTSLVITSTDGIFGRVTNLNNSLVFFGTTLTVPGVTGLTVSMLLGGDDAVTETTTFASNIDVGPGNDVVRVTGGAIDLAVAQQLQTPNGLQQVIASGIRLSPAKTIRGGAGNDTLTLTGAGSNVNMFGDDGNDVLNAPQLGFLVGLSGGGGSDFLRGPSFGSGNFLDGGADNDTVVGGFGSEFLVGGTGTDILVGLGGRDVYLAADVDLDFVLNSPTDSVSADTFDSLAFRLPALVPPLRTRGF